MVCRDLNIITYAKNMFSLEANKVVAVIMLSIFRFFGVFLGGGLENVRQQKLEKATLLQHII